MKNTFGQNMQITLFGESHGPYIGAVLDGLAPGIQIDEEYINHQLMLRRPVGKISTARTEEDKYSIVSGICNGYTTGTPLCILIPNTNTRSSDYDKLRTVPRPGHADYTATLKYHGFADYRGGGHFSGRITAAIVAAGAIVIPALRDKGISIGTHIASLADANDRKFDDYNTDITSLNNKVFAVLDDATESKMKEIIESAANDGDSVGGVLETAVIGMPGGVGEPWFDTLEGILSHALFSIPAIKGVEFGAGFDMTTLRGSENNDSFCVTNNAVTTLTNNNGGINGGISNGMPITIRCAVKPTPSIYKTQQSVNLETMTNTDLNIEGRHDPAIIHRARVVVDSMVALTLYDTLVGRYGTDYFGGK